MISQTVTQCDITSHICHKSQLHNHMLQKDIEGFRTIMLSHMLMACNIHSLWSRLRLV